MTGSVAAAGDGAVCSRAVVAEHGERGAGAVRRLAVVGGRGERGAGAISAVAGVAVFLVFLLLAVQVLVHLFATSAVSAAAFDAARLASGADGGGAAAARGHGLTVLGGFAGDVRAFDVAVGADSVTVHVVADSPALLPEALARVLGAAGIDRTVTVRREGPVCTGAC